MFNLYFYVYTIYIYSLLVNFPSYNCERPYKKDSTDRLYLELYTQNSHTHIEERQEEKEETQKARNQTGGEKGVRVGGATIRRETQNS